MVIHVKSRITALSYRMMKIDQTFNQGTKTVLVCHLYFKGYVRRTDYGLVAENGKHIKSNADHVVIFFCMRWAGIQHAEKSLGFQARCENS